MTLQPTIKIKYTSSIFVNSKDKHSILNTKLEKSTKRMKKQRILKFDYKTKINQKAKRKK